MPTTRLRKRGKVPVKDILTETTNTTQNVRNEPVTKLKKRGTENLPYDESKRGKFGKAAVECKKVQFFKHKNNENSGGKCNGNKQQISIPKTQVDQSCIVKQPITKKPVICPKKENRSELNNKLTLGNCFGFDEDDLHLNTPAHNSVSLKTFDPSKPYRLSLYIQSLHTSNATMTVNNNTHHQLSVLNQATCTLEKSTAKASVGKSKGKKTVSKCTKAKDGLVQKKITDMCVKPATRPANKQAAFKSMFDNSANTSSTFEDDGEHNLSLNAKVHRRSYVKKFKEKEAAEEEPCSELIMVELTRKKATKARTKKPAKDEKELENWAKTMNTMFDDIDKFELTVLDD